VPEETEGNYQTGMKASGKTENKPFGDLTGCNPQNGQAKRSKIWVETRQDRRGQRLVAISFEKNGLISQAV